NKPKPDNKDCWQKGDSLKDGELWLPLRFGTGSRILFCEGELKSQIASEVLGSEWSVCCIQRGAKQNDFSAFADCEILIWPDNDSSGFEQAQAIKAQLPNARILAIPSDKPSGWDAGDATAEEILEIVSQSPPVDDLTLHELVDIRPKRISFVIEGILPRGGISVLGGRANSGKSTVAAAEILSIATGQNLIGRRYSDTGELIQIKQGRVAIFWKDESVNTLVLKLWALCSRHGIDWQSAAQNIRFIDDDLFHLRDEETAKSVRERALKLHDWTTLDAVYIDSMTAVSPDIETDNSIATAVLSEILSLARGANLAIRMIHHVRKGPQAEREYTIEALRGSSSLIGWVDVAEILFATKNDDGKKIARIAQLDPKYRHTGDQPAVAWELTGQAVDLGDNGPPVWTGCISEYIESDPLEEIDQSQFDKVLKAIKDCAPDYRMWNVQATNWVGNLIGLTLNIDFQDKEARETIKAIIQRLASEGKIHTTKVAVKGAGTNTRQSKVWEVKG
ncbi:MAG: AAA family ATPase, partial [Gemmatimonadota bacterium]|nr:AAA family ATPase [Gemmatimonadota bacterium]